MAEHREKSQLIGDLLREAAVLWFALYPLEAYFNKNFDWFHFASMYCIAAAFTYFGDGGAIPHSAMEDQVSIESTTVTHFK